MANSVKPLVKGDPNRIAEIEKLGDPKDSWKAGWLAVKYGGEVIAEIQRHGRSRKWESMAEAKPFVDRNAKRLMAMRLEAIHQFKTASHHRRGFRMNARAGAARPRSVKALCLISGYKGQEIPGLVDAERVVVDAEHMEQALGPAAITEIFKIRKHVGENVLISTNVSESPQIVRSAQTGEVDVRSTAALSASKVIAAIKAGADIVKVGFANTDTFKGNLGSAVILQQMKLVREMLDAVVKEKLLIVSFARDKGRWPLVSVFFPEMGIDSAGERPVEIARKGIELTSKAGWQAMLIDTFEKFTGRRYSDFYSLEDTKALADAAHAAKIELWIAGSIRRQEVAGYLKCGVDLICFGGAARHEEGVRITTKGGKRDESIKRPLVEKLVAVFNRVDPKGK
jgi:uncharacterized protein (UPF0264 family)